MLRTMETDFNCLSGEKLMGYISKNSISDSSNTLLSAEKLLLTGTKYSEELDVSLEKGDDKLDRINYLKREIICMFDNNEQIGNKNQENFDKNRIVTSNNLDNKYNSCSSITYGKFRELTINQEIFLNLIDNWRKNVSIIINESYKNCKYTLEEGFELLEEGMMLKKRVELPEFDSLAHALYKSSLFENKVKKALSVDEESNVDLKEIKISKKIPIADLYELLKEGDDCLFSSKYFDFLRFQLDNLKSWRSTVQAAIIEKNLDKCKDSIKDKDEILIEVPGIDDLTEQIAASNWIEKVEKCLTRPMRLNFAENLLNEPAAKFLDENDVTVKKQLMNRVKKALDWVDVVQSPPFVFSLVNACKTCTSNEISEGMQLVLNDAKKLMETTKDWRFPKPFEFEKIWFESLTLKINIPIMKYLEPIYIRWRKWHKKFKRLLDGLCIYIEAQLILEEAEYTLCDFLDMSEYLPELHDKLKESGDWLNESKEFLRKLSDFHTKQDIDNVSSNIWNTITGIKKGNDFTKSEIQEVIKFIESQVNERLSYDKLKDLINIGNELTIYDRSIIQELSTCLDNCERWLKKAKELLKFSRGSNLNISSIISLLLERNCILISVETEEGLFAELYFLLWKMDLKEIEPPINDFELLSLIDRLNHFKIYIDISNDKNDRNEIDYSETQSVCNSRDEQKDLSSESEEIREEIKEKEIEFEDNFSQLESNFNSINSNYDLKELEIHQINISHWDRLKNLGPIIFVEKLQEVFIYWNELVSKYEEDKKSIETWRYLLQDLKRLPIVMNELESKICKFIDEYDRICEIISKEHKELGNNLEIENSSPILYSCEELEKLNMAVSKLPIIISNWDKWFKHIEDLKNLDDFTLSKFRYLQDEFINNNSESETFQIERNIVIDHLNIVNQKLISTSVWNITDFREIIKELKYIGKLIKDLEICENWINKIKQSEFEKPMNLEYWNQLLEEGKKIKVIDNEILNKFESELKISIEWNDFYQTVITSENNNKNIRSKRNSKLTPKKMNYNVAELLVGFQYGINKKIIPFTELENSLKSYIELRNKGIKYLIDCYHERRNFKFSKLLESYINLKNVTDCFEKNQEATMMKEIQNMSQLISILKNYIDECSKHPISVDFVSYIQEEIILYEINQKLINTLIIEEYPYFFKCSDKNKISLIEPRISNVKEATELISYIEKNNLNKIGSVFNSEQEKDCSTQFISKFKKIHVSSIEELKEKVLNDENISEDLEFINNHKEEKYIDTKLFEKFKDMFEKHNQWLNIFNMLGLALTDHSKTENFFGRKIPTNLLVTNVKSSINLLLQDYLNEKSANDQKTDFNTNLAFELNWGQILDPYSSEYTKFKQNKSKFAYLVNRLLHSTKKSSLNDNIFKENSIDDIDVCFDEKLTKNEYMETYSGYNVSLSANLLHYLRQNKEAILNRENGSEHYDYTLKSVRSFINERYFSYLPADGSNNLDLLKQHLKYIKKISYCDGIDQLNDDKLDLSNTEINSFSHRRNKRNKSLIIDERVNEENIDNILSIIKDVETPTLEVSLVLISYCRKHIKFEFSEMNDLCLMVEFTLLWMTLIVNRFPNILNTNSEVINTSYNICGEKIRKYACEFEDWEKYVEFNFYNLASKLNIGNIRVIEAMEHFNNKSNKIVQNTIDLKEFVLLIEICDQMPIQIPIKSRLVSNLVDALYWSICAREAILLLPKNTILRPWVHIDGINKEIIHKVKKSKISKIIDCEDNKYMIREEDVLRVFSNFNFQEQEYVNSEKNITDFDMQSNKKIPRSRGRPKRDFSNIDKNELLFEDIYNNLCISYKEFDQLSDDDHLPKSFYMWLLDKVNNHSFSINESKSFESTVNHNILKNCTSRKEELFYGWEDGYFYWYDKNISNSTEDSNQNEHSNSKLQYVGMIDPNYYPKKEIYENKLIVDYILCIELFNSIQNTPADLCSICSTFKKQKIKDDKNLLNKDIYALWIACDECNRWYHQDCVGYISFNNANNKNLNNHSNIMDENVIPWICPLCNLRNAKPLSSSLSIISFLKNSNNLLLCHDSNMYINADIYGQSICNNNVSAYESLIKREVPSQENLQKIFEDSFLNTISFIQLYERNMIANKFYLMNVWIYDFYEKFKWQVFKQSTFTHSIFIVQNVNRENSIENHSISKVENEVDELINENNDNDLIDPEKIVLSENMLTSRKGRVLKNKISVKEMLNPKISFIKPKKGRKRRLLLPMHSVPKQIKRSHSILNGNKHDLTNILQIDFTKIIPNVILENTNNIDIENIGRLKKLEFEQKYLDIDEVMNLYIIGTLIGVNEVVEIEWLYCILRYSIFFNQKFTTYNQILMKLKSFQLNEDLSFINALETEKRMKWDEFKYILKYYSPNFPIKLDSCKNFYTNMLKIRSNQLQCISILNQFLLTTNYPLINEIHTDQSYDADNEIIKINGKNFKRDIEFLLKNIFKNGVILPEEEVACQILRIYYLESVILFYRKQLSNLYKNQLNPKPIYTTLESIYKQILKWKETDSNFMQKYKTRIIPFEIDHLITEEENSNPKNQENKSITRLQHFIDSCDIIQDAINQCHEWNDKYNILKENSDEFEVHVELLKQGLNLPCIYPPVYIFGNVLASIESYEDYIHQVFDNSNTRNSHSSISRTNHHNQITNFTLNNNATSNQPLNPKFENIQVLSNIKEFLLNLPIIKKDLILIIDQMEKDTQSFIEDIKLKASKIKQLTSSEALISLMQSIKEDALQKVPIIVTNLPELRELLNNLPDFGSPHHNLLLKTQFLMSLQCPIAKVRKPLNPFPNFSDVNPNIFNFNFQNTGSNLNLEVKTEFNDLNLLSEKQSNKTNISANNGTPNRVISHQLNNMSLWQNIIQGNNPMNHYYYK